MKKQVLQVKLLGGFAVEYEGQELSTVSPRAQSLWKLFRFLLMNRGKAMTSEALIDLLWAEVEVENPRKALQNLIYRLRKLLPEKDQNGQEYILSQHRTYGWNAEAEVEVDAFRFLEAAMEGKSEKLTDEERCAKCKEAIALYTGELMEDLQEEKWVENLTSYYRRQYFECVNVLLDALQQMRKFDEVVNLCTKVLQTNVFEEHYHAVLIRAMLAQGNRYGALTHYRSITSLLMRELDVEPSEELLAAGRSIYAGGIRLQPDLGMVLDDLRSAAATSGPMICESDIFRYMFQFHERKIRRDMSPCMMVMCTIQSKGRSLTDEEMFQAMTALKRACVLTLRRSDVLTQQSNSQILLLLPGATEDNVKIILERILQKYALLCHNPVAVIAIQERSMLPELIS